MNKSWLLPRRTMLKGIGASLALPLLETMGWAETPKAGGYKPPVRMAFIYVPHGVNHDHFWPTEGKIGPSSALPSIIEPLRPIINDVLVLGGLDHRAEVDNRGHHACETAMWLSGVAGKRDKIEAGISADQLAAQKIGVYTLLPSLELALHQGKSVGDCDSGYSCAYHSHISWRSPTQPMPRELDPRAVFDRMFQSRKSRPNKTGNGPSVDTNQFASKSNDQNGGLSLDQSMLDLILENAKGLRTKVSGNDRQKLDQYLDGVRELEKRIQAIERQAEDQENAMLAKKGYKTSPIIAVKIPAAVSKKFDENAKLMLDLITLAFQSDTTRIVTLMFSQAFGRSYPECGVSENHHECSHHGINAKDPNWDPKKREKVRKINVFHMEQLSYFLQMMKSLNEGNGSLLDNSMILYGSGMSDGARHNHINLPTILAGRGGGTISSGRYVKECSGNFCDLLMGMLARAGCPTGRFGDGTKILNDLS